MSLEQNILAAYDSASLWSPELKSSLDEDVVVAYRRALAVQKLRVKRGETPVGYKIGFTTEGAMQKYGIAAPMWGFLWSTTVRTLDRTGTTKIDLTNSLQPRIEPELVVKMRRSPDPGAGKQEIFECIDSIGVGFEIVQCHCVGWDFSAAMAISDGGLHSKLIVGELIPVRMFARDASELEAMLAAATVELTEGGQVQAAGSGSNVLGNPLYALSLFFEELHRHSGALSGLDSYLITTGSWTNPLPIMPGQQWSGKFSHDLGELAVNLARE